MFWALVDNLEGWLVKAIPKNNIYLEYYYGVILSDQEVERGNLLLANWAIVSIGVYEKIAEKRAIDQANDSRLGQEFLLNSDNYTVIPIRYIGHLSRNIVKN